MRKKKYHATLNRKTVYSLFRKGEGESEKILKLGRRRPSGRRERLFGGPGPNDNGTTVKIGLDRRAEESDKSGGGKERGCALSHISSISECSGAVGFV